MNGRRSRVALMAALAMVTSLLLLAQGPGGASAYVRQFRPAPATSFVSLTSDGGYVGEGRSYLFQGTSSQLLYGDAVLGGLEVTVTGPDARFDLSFDPPHAGRLHTGSYASGLDVSGNGRGCNNAEGRFDVKDIAYDSGGKAVRFWATYEQHCDGETAATFGEVRLGAPSSSLRAEPDALRWPDTVPRSREAVVAGAIVNGSRARVRIGRPRIAGLDRRDFAIVRDGCRGRTLAPGGACPVLVRFAPRAAGPRTALLVARGGRRNAVTVLDGFGIAGRTRVSIRSDRGDFVGQGRHYTYNLPSSAITAGADRHLVAVSFAHPRAIGFQGTVAAPGSTALRIGHTYAATTYRSGGSPTAGIDFESSEGACQSTRGRFRFDRLSLDGRGRPRSFAFDFFQACRGNRAGLHGHVEYRVPVGDRRPPGAVRHLRIGRRGSVARISWTNPGARDLKGAIVRYAVGGATPRDANSGLLAGAGHVNRLLFRVPRRGPVRAVVFTVDGRGNVSRSRVAVLR